MKKKLLVTGFIPEYLIAPFRDRFDITMPDEKKDRFTLAEVKSLINGQDAIFTLYAFKFQRELIELASSVKVVANGGVGFDNIDVKACTEQGIYVVNTPASVAQPTAEMTFAIMMAITKGIVMYDRAARANKNTIQPFFFDRDILDYGKTLGIVGFGRIGQALAKKAQGIGMHVIYYDPFRRSGEEEEKLGVTFAAFDELIAVSDVISCHMPYTPENHHTFDYEIFQRMKKTAYFINAARGPIVNQKDLIQALKDKEIRGAGLDVYEFEPEIPAELTELENVVLTPHVGSNVIECRREMLEEAIGGTYRLLNGTFIPNIVNREEIKIRAMREITVQEESNK